MAIGIVSFGAYIPAYRLSQSEITRAWGSGIPKGEKAIANWDEDSITMGVEAALDCIGGIDRSLVDSLYFATTTSPYHEKQNASIIAAAADLRKDIYSLDITNSLRAGSNAMKTATDAVVAGSAHRALVTIADCRIPAPRGELESVFGDASAALMIGKEDVAVEIEGSYSFSSEFIDIWKEEGGRYPHSWEDRFVDVEGYRPLLSEGVSRLLSKYGLKPGDFSKAVYYAPNARRHREMAGVLGFDQKNQVQTPLYDSIGNAGAASAFVMLVAALEEAKPGDRILFAIYGDGVDAFVLRVTENIAKVQNRRGVKKHLASKMMLGNYEKYLRFRNLLEWDVDLRPPYRSSLPVTWRERNQIYRLYGSKCNACGTIQIPQQRVCGACRAKDDYAQVRLSDKRAKIFTYCIDQRSGVTPDLPNVVALGDFEGGGRFYSPVTDRDPEQIQIGMAVEMTFRKVNQALWLNNYFWKFRPVRVE